MEVPISKKPKEEPEDQAETSASNEQTTSASSDVTDTPVKPGRKPGSALKGLVSSNLQTRRRQQFHYNFKFYSNKL